jgi:hypothetical protein
MEEISRRILAPAVGGSQVQTHWFYERARGQYMNEQAGMTAARQAQFARMNPRPQVITKTDLAKVENCFDLLPDTASRGAEKSFTAFAERVTKEWADENKRTLYGDDWYRSAVARVILFRTTEALVSKAPWYEGGYRAQVVYYATARLSALSEAVSKGGRLDFLKIWASQGVDDVLKQQLLEIAEVMMGVLRSPPQAGQNVTEWAKQQACRANALAKDVPIVPGFDRYVITKDETRAAAREQKEDQRVADGLMAVTEVMGMGAESWRALRSFTRDKRMLTIDDQRILEIACAMPRYVPSDRQAERLLTILQRCKEIGFEHLAAPTGAR